MKGGVPLYPMANSGSGESTACRERSEDCALHPFHSRSAPPIERNEIDGSVTLVDCDFDSDTDMVGSRPLGPDAKLAVIIVAVAIAIWLAGCVSMPVGHGEIGIGYNAQDGRIFLYSKAYPEAQEAKASYEFGLHQWLADLIVTLKTMEKQSEMMQILQETSEQEVDDNQPHGVNDRTVIDSGDGS